MSLGAGALGSVRAFVLSAPSANDRFAITRHLAETLAIAAAGGATLGLTGFPAGWLSGSILAVAGASLAGRPMLIPTLLMRAIFVLIGISLGAVVTPETLHGMATYPLSIAVLLLAMAFISIGGAGYLRLMHRWGKVDAYLAAAPGGMSQVLALGAELGGDLRAIAIVQSIRVVVIAVGLPAGLSLLGLVGHAAPRTTGVVTLAVLDELAILVAVSTLAALIAYWVRFPGGLLFGAMAHLCRAPWQRPDSRGHALVGCKYRDGSDGRHHWFTLRQYTTTIVIELCRCRIRLVRGRSSDRCCICGRSDQRTFATRR